MTKRIGAIGLLFAALAVSVFVVLGDPPGPSRAAVTSEVAPQDVAPSSEAPPAPIGPAEAIEAPTEREAAAAVIASDADGAGAAMTTAPAHLMVRGRVVDAVSGAGLAGIHVFAGLDPRAPTDPSESETDGTGAFEFRPDNPFVRMVWIEAEGYALAKEKTVSKREGDRRVLDAGTIQLHRGTRVTGRVLDTRGVPVAGAELRLHEAPIDVTSFLPAAARPVGTTDASGWFDLRALPPSRDGGAPLFAVADEGLGRVDLDLPGGRVEGVEIRLFPSAVMTVDVVDERGEPVALARVEAIPLHETFITKALQKMLRHGSYRPTELSLGKALALHGLLSRATDEAGRVSFERLPADEGGAYALVARAEDYVDAWLADVPVTAGGASHETIKMTTHRLRRIEGVVRTEGGAAVADVEVVVTSSALVRHAPRAGGATTDRDGRFAITSIDPSSIVWLSIDAEAWARLPVRVDVPADEDVADVLLVAQRSHPVTVIVVDQTGAPVEGARGSIKKDGFYAVSTPPVGGRGRDAAVPRHGRRLMAPVGFAAGTEESMASPIPVRAREGWRDDTPGGGARSARGRGVDRGGGRRVDGASGHAVEGEGLDGREGRAGRGLASLESGIDRADRRRGPRRRAETRGMAGPRRDRAGRGGVGDRDGAAW